MHAVYRLGVWALLLMAAGSSGCQGEKLQRVLGFQAELRVPTDKGLLAVWGSSAKDVWAVGSEGTVLHYDGSALTLVPSGVKPSLLSVHGAGPNNVWVAGDEGVSAHWDGRSFTPSAAVKDAVLLGTWVRGADDAWLVGVSKEEESGLLRHWDGKRWGDGLVPGSASLWEIWGFADELWMVGTSAAHAGLVQRTKGHESSVFPFQGKSLRSVWGSSLADVWVLPYDEAAQHWDGKAWSTPPWVAGGAMLCLWGSSPNDVWAVGLGGRILHFDGKAWTAARSPMKEDLWSIWGSSPSDVWAVGANATVLRFDGTAWRSLPHAANRGGATTLATKP